MQVLFICSHSMLVARGQLAPMSFVWNSIGGEVMSVQSVHSNFQGNLFKAQAIHWKRHWDLKELRMHKDWPRKRGVKNKFHKFQHVDSCLDLKLASSRTCIPHRKFWRQCMSKNTSTFLKHWVQHTIRSQPYEKVSLFRYLSCIVLSLSLSISLDTWIFSHLKAGPLGSSTAVKNFMLSLPRQFFQGRATYKANVPRTYVG